MRYSQDYIDEVLQCYSRVQNISYVSRKYDLNIHTLRYWIEREKKVKEKEAYANHLAKIAEVVQYFNEVGNYDLVAEKYEIEPNKIETVLEEYKEELHFKTRDYKEKKGELLKLLGVFSKAYSKNKSENILEKLIQIEKCLGNLDDYIIAKYDLPQSLLNKVKETL